MGPLTEGESELVEQRRTHDRPRAGDPIASGWAALSRGDWGEAKDLFERAVSVTESPEGFEGLSWARWWLNEADAMFEARERAYNLYRESGDRAGAARMATWLGTDHFDFRGEPAVGHGWLGRARRLLVGLEPGAEYGWLLVHEGEKYLLANEIERAIEAGAHATDLGRGLAIADLEGLGLATEGLAMVTEGRVADGMSRLDEAAAAAFGGEFTEIWAAAWCGCYVLYACERARDYGRAGEWCRRIDDWSERMEVAFVNSVCRAHYAGVLVWNGTWPKAEEMLVESAERLSATRPPAVAEAAVRLGELRRRQGRLDEAARIFESVAEHPLALLGLGDTCLDQGDAASARDRAHQYLREAPPNTGTVRAAGLELLVRALAALGNAAEAKASLEELGTVAEQFGTDPLRGSAAFATGVHAAASGDIERARTSFEDATRFYHRSGAPFEAARSRIELAQVLVGAGRQKDALREVRSAATSLRRIGAEHEAARADTLAIEFARGADTRASPITPREREVLRLVAEGKSDKAIAQELVLSEHTVHRHVANILTKLGCPSRSAAVAEAVRRELI